MIARVHASTSSGQVMLLSNYSLKTVVYIVFFFYFLFFIAIQRTLLTKQDKNTTNNTTNNTTKIRYVNYLLHSTSLQYTTFTFFLFLFLLYTYIPSQLQSRRGFHLASSILPLLYLAAM